MADVCILEHVMFVK